MWGYMSQIRLPWSCSCKSKLFSISVTFVKNAIAISIRDQSGLAPSCFVNEEISKFQLAAHKNALKLCPGSTIGPLYSITHLRVQILVQIGILETACV